MHVGDVGRGIIVSGIRVCANRLLNFISIAIPMVVTGIAFSTLERFLPSLTTLLVFIGFFLAGIMGLGVGLHRYFTHSAFRTSRPLRVILAFFSSLVMQGPIDRWVADHRRHHRYADRPFDPHSPYWKADKKINSRIRGLIHSHLGWMTSGSVSDEKVYARDIINDPIALFFSRTYWFWSAMSFVLPAAIGWLFGGLRESIACLLWAGGARICLLQNLTWSVNSIGHTFGTKVAGSGDEARDNICLALLLFGEGLHSYHHKNPRAAINEPTYLDFGGLLLRLLSSAGIIWNLRRR